MNPIRPTRLIRSALAVAGVSSLGLLGVGFLAAAPASADATTAVVRSAHFSPDTAGVDVYLAPFSGGTTTLWVSDEKYGTISSYRRLAVGAYIVSMRPHDAPASTRPTLTWTLNATAGSAYTAAAIGQSAKLQAVVLTDTLTPPAAGTGRVRIVQAAGTAPSVSVQANGGVVLADRLRFGATSGYQVVPTGLWDVRATADSGTARPVTGSVAVPAGSSSTVVVLDGGSGALRLTSVQDSASAGTVPVGSVDAGGGGTATAFTGSSGPGPSWEWLGGLAVLASALLGGFAWRRRRHVGVG